MLFSEFRSKDTRKKLIPLSFFTVILIWIISQLDFAVIAYFSQIQTTQTHAFWTFITNLGHGGVYFALCFLGLLIGYWGQSYSALTARKLFKFSSISLASLISAGFVVRLLKWVIGRPRPKVWIEHDISNLSPYSFMSEFNAFPSGHTQTAFTVAFLLTLLIPRHKITFFAIAGLIGISRVALLKHWPLDILMGAMIGVIIPALVTRFFVKTDPSPFNLCQHNTKTTNL